MCFSLQCSACWVDQRPQKPEVSLLSRQSCCISSLSTLFVHLNSFVCLVCSFDGIVLVTESYETLPDELECLKAPLQDYSSVSVCSSAPSSQKQWDWTVTGVHWWSNGSCASHTTAVSPVWVLLGTCFLSASLLTNFTKITYEESWKQLTRNWPTTGNGECLCYQD